MCNLQKLIAGQFLFPLILDTVKAFHFIVNIFNNHWRLFKSYNCPLGWTFNITDQRPLLFRLNSILSDEHKGEHPNLNIKTASLLRGSYYKWGRFTRQSWVITWDYYFISLLSCFCLSWIVINNAVNFTFCSLHNKYRYKNNQTI